MASDTKDWTTKVERAFNDTSREALSSSNFFSMNNLADLKHAIVPVAASLPQLMLTSDAFFASTSFIAALPALATNIYSGIYLSQADAKVNKLSEKFGLSKEDLNKLSDNNSLSLSNLGIASIIASTNSLAGAAIVGGLSEFAPKIHTNINEFLTAKSPNFLQGKTAPWQLGLVLGTAYGLIGPARDYLKGVSQSNLIESIKTEVLNNKQKYERKI